MLNKKIEDFGKANDNHEVVNCRLEQLIQNETYLITESHDFYPITKCNDPT